MANTNLSKAKSAKNDEFYTQYADIQKEVNAYLDYDANVFRGKTILLPCDDPEWSNFTKFFAQNFERFGLKKLISTSYAIESKNAANGMVGSRVPRDRGFYYQPTLFETAAPQFDKKKTRVRGKIFVLDHDTNKNGRIDIEDLEWDYLKGDGDFRSDEVKKLRDEADIIVTNPPFSLFREFLAWIVGDGGHAGRVTLPAGGGDGGHAGRMTLPAGEGRDARPARPQKQFLIIGNMNALKYKEAFPLIQKDQMWLGATGFSTDMVFAVPKGTVVPAAYKEKAERMGYVGDYTRLGNSCWYTNLEHGRRHQPLQLMTEADNIKFSKHKEIRDVGYQHYENYDAIEVPYTDAIPSDYKGMMGVPISFLDKYCPEQFEILGMCENEDAYGLKTRVYSSAECKAAYLAKFGKPGTYDLNASAVLNIDGILEKTYHRLFIRHRKQTGKGGLK